MRAVLHRRRTAGGRCPEHGTEPEQVSEENWFFRLSRYAAPLREAITSGRLRIEPAGRRHEVLALIDGGLADFSVSRPAGRAGGWGIPVPGDPEQVIYVWFDALCNYVTALGYGRDGAVHGGAVHGEAYQRWWAGRGNRVHLLGKGVLRFHAVYWPAMLLASGQPLPTATATGGANRFVNRVRPWDLAKADAGGRLDAVLYLLARACSAAGRELAPFLPDAAARITWQCTPRDGRLPAPSPVFRRLAR